LTLPADFFSTAASSRQSAFGFHTFSLNSNSRRRQMFFCQGSIEVSAAVEAVVAFTAAVQLDTFWLSWF